MRLLEISLSRGTLLRLISGQQRTDLRADLLVYSRNKGVDIGHKDQASQDA